MAEVQEKAELIDLGLGMFNGEKEYLFDEKLIENKLEQRAIPEVVSIGWRDTKGQGYGGGVDFDEEEIIKVFKEIYKENKEAEAELVITINHSNNFMTALLKCGDKKIRLPKTKVEVFQSRKLTIEKK